MKIPRLVLQGDIDKFMEVWIFAIKNGYGIEYVQKELNYPNKQTISDSASYLRKLGLELPRMNIGLAGRKQLLKKANEKLKEIESEL